MSAQEQGATLKNIASHAKEYGFIYQSSEIYDGLSAAYDYGPNGVILKNKIKEYWWRSMVQLHENIVELNSASQVFHMHMERLRKTLAYSHQ